MTRQLEKHITLALPGSESLALDGIFAAGSGPGPGGAVIASPHPLYGGSMFSPVVGEVAHACGQAGYATIRFDWRGVGASAGAPSGEPTDADADYVAALEYLAETAEGPLVAAGYSFGAAAAVRAAARHPRVRKLVLVSPPPALLDASALAGFRGSALLVVGDSDEFAPVEALEALVRDQPRRRLEVIGGRDHFFMSGVAEVGRAVSGFLAP